MNSYAHSSHNACFDGCVDCLHPRVVPKMSRNDPKVRKLDSSTGFGRRPFPTLHGPEHERPITVVGDDDAQGRRRYGVHKINGFCMSPEKDKLSWSCPQTSLCQVTKTVRFHCDYDGHLEGKGVQEQVEDGDSKGSP